MTQLCLLWHRLLSTPWLWWILLPVSCYFLDFAINHLLALVSSELFLPEFHVSRLWRFRYKAKWTPSPAVLPWRWINKWTCSNFCTLMRTFVQFSSLCLKASCTIQDSILHFWRPEHGEERYRNTIRFTSQPPAHFSTNMEQSRLRQNFNFWLNILLISRKQ